MSIIQAIILGIVQGITEFFAGQQFRTSGDHPEYISYPDRRGLFLMLCCILVPWWRFSWFTARDILRMIVETVNMCGDIIYNLKSYIQNQRSYSALRYRKIVKQLSQVCGIGAGIYHTDRYHWLYRKGNGGKSECNTDRSGNLPDPDFHFAGGIRENTERQKIPKDISYGSGFLIGAAQGMCHTSGTFPRSGTTIAACLMSGYDRRFAVRYSFIMSIPAILGAAVLEDQGSGK